MLAIGMDLGGTAVKAVVIDHNGNVQKTMSRPLGQHATSIDEWHWKGVVKSVASDLLEEFGDANLKKKELQELQGHIMIRV